MNVEAIRDSILSSPQVEYSVDGTESHSIVAVASEGICRTGVGIYICFRWEKPLA